MKRFAKIMRTIALILTWASIALLVGCGADGSHDGMSGDYEQIENVSVAEVEAHLQMIDSLNDTILSQEHFISELKQQIDNLQNKSFESQNDSPQDEIFENENGLLQIRQQKLEVKRDLMKRPELIPVEGILGGVMNFYSEELIFVTHRYVFAVADDGHFCVYMILTYNISEAGDIEWKLLAYAFDNDEGLILVDSN